MGWRDDEEAARQAVRHKFRDVYSVLGDLSSSKNAVLGRSTSTGVVSLDAALGGPLPSGAIEIYGEAAVGKTSLLYEIIHTAQESGMLTALCPSEYLDIPYMRSMGVDLNGLILITGNHGEDVLSAASDYLRDHSDIPVLLALDSATSLRPKDDGPGEWTKMLDDFLAGSLEYLNKSSCIVMVNQVRVRRSIDPSKFFVDGEVASTAKKILDRFSLRLELRRGESRGGSHEMEVCVVASTVSKPSTVLCVPFSPWGGIDTMRDLLQYAVSLDVVSKRGVWYIMSKDGSRLGDGIEDTLARLEREPELAASLLDQVMVRA